MWKTMKLDDIASLSLGKTPSRSNPKFWDKEKNSKNIWLSIADLSASNQLYIEDSKEYVSDEGAKLFKEVPAETLIMSFKLSIGKLAITKCALRTNEAIIAMPIKDEKLISKKYLYYFLSSVNWDVLAGKDIKVKGKTLNKAKLKELPILVPPLAEQERIVAKLDAAFVEIDGAIKNINLKESKLDKLKSAIISDSYRGNGWDNERLGDCVSYEKNNAKGSSLPYVGMKNIAPETMDLVGEVIIPEKTSSTFHFNKSHVLFGRLRPYLRKVLVPDFEGQCSTEIFCIKPKDKVIREFLAYWLLEQKISLKIEATSTGARMPRANMNALLEFDFPIPSTKEQKKIISKIDLTFTKISEAKNTLAKSKTNYFSLKSAILSQELQPSEAA